MNIKEYFDQLDRPSKPLPQDLHRHILDNFPGLNATVKWNAPTYSSAGVEFLTVNYSKSGQMRLVFHRGARKQTPPPEHLISDPDGRLKWSANDRAVLEVNPSATLEELTKTVDELIKAWVAALS